MNKTALVAVGLMSILGISACSSDSKLSITTSKAQTETSADASGSGSADSSGSDDSGNAGSIPDLSGVPGLTGDCTNYLTAIASAFTPNAEGVQALADSFDTLEGQVPDDLKDDVKVLAEGFAKLQTLYEKYDFDYTKIATDPEAATLFSDSKFTEASNNVTAWLNTECPTG